MKKILLLTIVLLNCKCLFAQYSFTTDYYDYAPPPQSFTASNDSGIAMCKLKIDTLSMYATAGCYRTGTNDQGIRIGVYNTAGTLITEINYNLTGYKETAVKILAQRSSNFWLSNVYSVYVVCKTVNIASGAEGLLILSYRITANELSLVPLKSALYSQSGIYNPVDACATSCKYRSQDSLNFMNRIIVLCNKKEGTDTKIAVYQFNEDLQVTRSYLYNYTDTKGSIFNEVPLCLKAQLTDDWDGSYEDLYEYFIAGRVANSTIFKSSALIIKLNWQFSAVWAKTSAMNYGLNSYNDIFIKTEELFGSHVSTEVLVCGAQSTTTTSSLWKVARVNLATGAIIQSLTYGDNTSYSEALKLTITSNGNIAAAGFRKKSATDEFKLVSALYTPTLSSGAYYTPVSLAYGSVIKDISFTSDGAKTMFVGQKKSGSLNTAYLYFTNDVGNVDYQNFINTTSSGFNSIAIYDIDHFAVTGYMFGPVLSWQNNRFITRTYNRSLALKSIVVSSKLQIQKKALLQNSPNPFSQSTRINYSIPQPFNYAYINIVTINGAIIKSFPITQKGSGQVTLQASTLPAGVYYYNLVADGNLLGSKTMILVR